MPEPSKPCDFGTSKRAEQVRTVIEPVKPELDKPKSVPILSASRHDRGGEVSTIAVERFSPLSCGFCLSINHVA